MSTPPATQLPVLWASFFTSHTVIAGLAFFVPAEPVADPSWVPLLGLPAVAAAGLSVQGGVLARAAPQVLTWFILRFALAETAGLLGFVSYFLSGDHLVQLGCAAIGLVAHLLAFPGARAAQLYAAARR